MGYRKDTGSIPYLDVYFSDDFDKTDDGTPFQVLRTLGECEVLGQNSMGKVWALRVGKTLIVSKRVPDLEGWMPRGAVLSGMIPGTKRKGSFFEEVLGAWELEAGEQWEGFAFEGAKKPIVYIWPSGETANIKIRFPWWSKVGVYHPNGQRIPLNRGRTLDAILIRSRWALTAKPQMGIEGPHVESFDVRHVLVFEGANPRKIEKVCRADSKAPSDVALVEGESPTGSNFNFGSIDGLPLLNKGAFHLLETYVPPSEEEGYYVRYSLNVPKKGLYSIWVRERYLLFQSPCHWRIDDGDWQAMPSEAVPTRSEAGIVWSLFDDDTGVFSWYKYGEASLTKGSHVLEFRIDKPCPNGAKYCKGIDLISLVRDREQTLRIKPFGVPVNLAPNPSFEEGEGVRVEGWELSCPPGKSARAEWKRNEWGPKRKARCGHHCLSFRGSLGVTAAHGAPGDAKPHPYARSKAFGIKGGANYGLNAWIRSDKDDNKSYIGVRFYDEGGKQLNVMSRQIAGSSSAYSLGLMSARAPERARYAVIQLGYLGEKESSPAETSRQDHG